MSIPKAMVHQSSWKKKRVPESPEGVSPGLPSSPSILLTSTFPSTFKIYIQSQFDQLPGGCCSSGGHCPCSKQWPACTLCGWGLVPNLQLLQSQLLQHHHPELQHYWKLCGSSENAYIFINISRLQHFLNIIIKIYILYAGASFSRHKAPPLGDVSVDY